MFDWSEIAELDGNAAADRLAASRERVLAAEAEQFVLAAHWADLHAPEFVARCRAGLPGTAVLPGLERGVRSGADGTPQIGEFAAAELAALLGRSTAGGQQLVADAVNVRHRHPVAWAGICTGTVRVWVAVQVARRCAAAGLTRDQARSVDAATTPYLTTLPTGRFLDLVTARIAEADPAAATARAHAAGLARFVRTGRCDEHGMKTLITRARAGEVLYLVAVLDRIAHLLAATGDTDPLEARRATALRILANPARALTLLTATTLTTLDPDSTARTDRADDDPGAASDAGHDIGAVPAGEIAQAAAEGHAANEEPGSSGEEHGAVATVDAVTVGDAVAARDVLGAVGARGGDSADPAEPGDGLHSEWIAGSVRDAAEDLSELEDAAWMLDTAGRALPGMPRRPVTVPPVAPGDPVEEAADPRLLRDLLAALGRFDPTRLDPVAVFHLHLSATTLTTGSAVARGERLGPQLAADLQAWLIHPVGGLPGHTDTVSVQLRPVLDASTVRPVDRYEFPAPTSELATLRTPYEVFPYGTLCSRTAEDDHVIAYDHRPGAPPGQTSIENNAKLSRHHHRLKTHGNWRLLHPEPGVYWWRTPHGHWLRVDPTGTHHHGRDPHLDQQLLGPATLEESSA